MYSLTHSSSHVIVVVNVVVRSNEFEISRFAFLMLFPSFVVLSHAVSSLVVLSHAVPRAELAHSPPWLFSLTHILTNSLSLVLVVMMRSKELKTSRNLVMLVLRFSLTSLCAPDTSDESSILPSDVDVSKIAAVAQRAVPPVEWRGDPIAPTYLPFDTTDEE